ncbi:glycosyltransferase 87 family protein [Stackebrandtia nassauensis]|uniref:DUF2029 domain-containing protein n=1 Tax=Stackebrandtia nassauensis (strain DSM 44728 / CIP 108903 / NRRL B-16338 / NBRC 102104 / LLR-40K-21) TaxID=446470 RepID=D3Q5M1_STANL|nr:glycosyltransferase 87 family protein [Stackebrandtia nassauensis]ADD46081.1 hypothetical protein Snas_6466 [Stackebrandtia nassauensis DSM 44728]
MERTTKGGLYLDFALYGVSAVFAIATALWSTLEPHRVWGGMATGGYLPAALLTLMLLFRYAVPVVTRMWITVAAAVAVTLMPLVGEAAQRAAGVAAMAQEEVLVVESGGVRLLETGSPYLSLAEIAKLPDALLGYNPYQPGMSVFGLPRALFGQNFLTDARIWFAVATLAATLAALTMLRRAGLTRGAWVRGLQAVGVLPICALTLATGGDDLPVVALCLLAFACVATGRFTGAGFAIGGAAALKLLAWPVLIVVLVLAFKRGRLLPLALPALALPLGTLAPILITHPAEYFANVIQFPLGNGLVASPAASPLPGHLIAAHLPSGRVFAIALLVLAGAAVGWLVLARPPATAFRAAGLSAVGLLAAILLLPATRFGYLLYPAVFGVWWWVLKQIEAPASQWGPHTDPASEGTEGTETAGDTRWSR